MHAAGLGDDRRIWKSERRGPTVNWMATSYIWTCLRGREPEIEDDDDDNDDATSYDIIIMLRNAVVPQINLLYCI